MGVSAKTSKVSSQRIKIQDVPDIPTVTGITENARGGAALDVAVSISNRGGKPDIIRAISTPGNIEGISYGSSPITVDGLTPGTSYTFSVRGETSTGANIGYSAISTMSELPTSSIVPITSFVGGSAEVVGIRNIPQIYQDLMLVITALPTGPINIGLDNWNLAQSNVVSYVRLYSDGATSYSTRAATQPNANQISGQLVTATYPTTAIVHFMNYASTTTYKTVIGRIANDRNGAGTNYFNLATIQLLTPITDFNITDEIVGTYWSANSRFTLYGIKGA